MSVLASLLVRDQLIPVERVQQAIQESARTMTAYRLDHRVCKPDGRTVWLRIRSTPQRLPNGDILWNGVAIDITEQKRLDKLNQDLPPLKEFILPAGGKATSSCHLARSVCRRTERRCVSLDRDEKLNPAILTYLNRLSDLLFVIARTLARAEGGQEVYWNRDKSSNRTSS